MIAENAWDYGVTHLTFWALSIDNLEKRDKTEVDSLKALLHEGVLELSDMIAKKERKIKFQVVGDTGFRIPWQTLAEMDRLEHDTRGHIGGTLTLLVAYDGVWDLNTGLGRARIEVGENDPCGFLRKHMPSGHLPDVDFMIRTGGESHLSGAALSLQMANAHLYFLPKFWPLFSITDLGDAVEDFTARQRRFGA